MASSMRFAATLFSFNIYTKMRNAKKSTNPQDPTSCMLSHAQKDLLLMVHGIDAWDYVEAIQGLFRQTAMFAPVTEEVQKWFINADALASKIEALAYEPDGDL